MTGRRSGRGLAAGGRAALLLAVAVLAGCDIFDAQEDDGSGSDDARGLPRINDVELAEPPDGGWPTEAACTFGDIECDGMCVDVLRDDAHCGGCGQACAPEQYCSAGRCVPRPCPWASCSERTACDLVTGRCYEVECTEDAHCEAPDRPRCDPALKRCVCTETSCAPQGTCIAGRCAAICQGDEGCTSAEQPVCRYGRCVCQPGSCPPGQRCPPDGGYCVPGCQFDSECDADPTQPKCIDGVCRCVPTSCPSGFYCDPDSGACAEGCLRDEECIASCDAVARRCEAGWSRQYFVVPAASRRMAGVWTGSAVLLFDGRTPSRSTDGGFTWSRGALKPGEGLGQGFALAWSGTELLLFGGITESGGYAGGYAYDPGADRWRALPSAGAPSPRTGAAVAWTGSELFVFGGWDRSGPLADGALYDPSADAWRPLPAGGPVGASFSARGAFARGGGEVLLVGADDGASPVRVRIWVLDTVAGSWRELPSGGATPAGDVLAWNGTYLLAWGGPTGPSTVTNEGWRWSEASGIWEPVTLTGAPRARADAGWAVLDGRFAIWGGRVATQFGAPVLNDGAIYDPEADRWEPLPLYRAPAGRFGHAMVGMGRSFLVAGGDRGRLDVARYGRIYDLGGP